MEPPENRDSRDAALELGGTRNRLLLRESLVRTRLVVEAHELGDEASEVVLGQVVTGILTVAAPPPATVRDGVEEVEHVTEDRSRLHSRFTDDCSTSSLEAVTY